MKNRRVMAIAALAIIVTLNSQAADSVDQDLAHYTKASGVSGNISSVGSDTLANLMTLWTEEFKRFTNPDKKQTEDYITGRYG